MSSFQRLLNCLCPGDLLMVMDDSVVVFAKTCRANLHTASPRLVLQLEMLELERLRTSLDGPGVARAALLDGYKYQDGAAVIQLHLAHDVFKNGFRIRNADPFMQHTNPHPLFWRVTTAHPTPEDATQHV